MWDANGCLLSSMELMVLLNNLRLVVKGFTQTYGVEYYETFSHVANLNTMRVLLFIVMNKDWCLYQLHPKNAFLNEDLEEEVYMSPPSRFEA